MILKLNIIPGSGYIFSGVEAICLHVVNYKPVGGSAYIPLPKELRGRQCLLNICNTGDEMCLAYSVIADHYPTTSNKTSPESYKKYLDTLKI